MSSVVNSIAITGMGIICPIGDSLEAVFQALCTSRSGIGTLCHINSIHKNDIKVGEIKHSNEAIGVKLDIKPEELFSRTSLLGLYAAKKALAHAKIKDINEHKTGLISSTTVGGMDLTEQHFNSFAFSKANHKYLNCHQPFDSTEKIAAAIGLKGFRTTISTACSSSANAIMLGARMISSGMLDRVIVGGSDCLSKFTINGFKSLMLLSDAPCKPFDANRNGLNLGEGAAYLILESETMVKAGNKKVLARLSGYGNTNDAHHQTASSPNGEGAYLAMMTALAKANLKPNDIDYINAHGTATPNNDASESMAFCRVFENSIPSFSSTKSFTGHTLAAAGAMEAVFSILAITRQTVFPNLNFQTPIAEKGLKPLVSASMQPVKHVLSNSFGFGGNCTSLIFTRQV